MDTKTVTPNTSSTVSIWDVDGLNRSASVQVTDRNGATQSFSAYVNTYRMSASVTIPAQYLTAEALPVTANVTFATGKTVSVKFESNVAAPASTTKTKRVTMSLGAPRTQSAAAALANWAERIPVRTPRTTKRWRLRIANRALLPTAAPIPLTQQFTLGDVFLGAPGALSADGRPTGAWAATPTKIINSVLLKNDGTDWVSDWIADEALQFGPNDTKQLGFTLSGTNNGNGVALTSSHYGFRSITAGINAVNGSQLARTNFSGNTLALDKRIEYEFEGEDPVGLLIGASGDEGYNLTVALDGAGGYEVLPVYETWAGVHGFRSKVHWVNASIVGATQTPFLDKNNLNYTRFDLATTVPDFAVVSLGGNSVLAGGVLATIKTEVATVVAQVRALGIKRVYLATICPAGLAAGSANEILRNNFNDWIRTNPFMCDGVIDVDLILRDPTNKLVQMPGFVTADNVHPNHGGYQRWGMSVPNLK